MNSPTTPGIVALTLDDAQLEHLADLVADRLRSGQSTSTGDVEIGWLTARQAATYLGLPSVHAVHKLTSRGDLTCTQEQPGARLYFKRADLDKYRERGRREARAVRRSR